MHKQLVHFIVPPALVTTLTVITLRLALNSIYNNTYIQLVTAHTLVLTGLFLVVFVQPPVRFLALGDKYSGDWRPTYVAGGVFVFFNIALQIPYLQNLFKLYPLASLQDYLIVWGMALVWAILTLGLWHFRWLRRVLEWSSGWMVTTKE